MRRNKPCDREESSSYSSVSLNHKCDEVAQDDLAAVPFATPTVNKRKADETDLDGDEEVLRRNKSRDREEASSHSLAALKRKHDEISEDGLVALLFTAMLARSNRINSNS